MPKFVHESDPGVEVEAYPKDESDKEALRRAGWTEVASIIVPELPDTPKRKAKVKE